MTLTAIHKVTGTRIIAEHDGDIRKDYDEWDQLVCPVSGLPVFPRRGHLRGEKSRVRQHFVVKAPAAEGTWPEEVVFDPEFGTESRDGIRRVGGESWEHMESKALAAELLRKEVGPTAEIIFEKRIQIRPDKYRIADVAVVYPSGMLEAHEIQLAAITKSEIQERTDDYAEAGCAAQWWLGKNTADRYELRDYLRSIQGGFYLFEFQESVPVAAQHLVATEDPVTAACEADKGSSGNGNGHREAHAESWF